MIKKLDVYEFNLLKTQHEKNTALFNKLNELISESNKQREHIDRLTKDTSNLDHRTFGLQKVGGFKGPRC